MNRALAQFLRGAPDNDSSSGEEEEEPLLGREHGDSSSSGEENGELYSPVGNIVSMPQPSIKIPACDVTSHLYIRGRTRDPRWRC